ncbi:hypothetical protein ACFX15_024342 [Malus domestica]
MLTDKSNSETPKLSSIQVPEESRKPSSFFVHRSSKIKPRRPLKKVFFVHRSSKIKPQRPFGSTIIHQFKIKPRRPLKKVFFVLPRSSPDGHWINHPPIQDQAPTTLEESTIVHHPFIQDQAPTALWINKRRQIHTSNRSSRSSPKALEDPFITVLQDQAQKPSEIRSSLFFKDQAQKPL